ncbi:unnamed protein product [Dovyalis caffra]|uniref:Uncharacterized protein n=1 Tax=Dovyalis caffra TaxID=77055 RepID=A0AAV1RQ16_9ROSI|nr:unnamed protein product [Dovyalis caffra]
MNVGTLGYMAINLQAFQVRYVSPFVVGMILRPRPRIRIRAYLLKASRKNLCPAEHIPPKKLLAKDENMQDCGDGFGKAEPAEG